MPIQRAFLGWDSAVLPRAAAWLRGRYGCTMGEVVVVVPVARAGRRLLELLVEATEGEAFVPPRIVTVGEAPELLYDDGAVVDALRATLLRVETLREADGDVLASVVPHPPGREDWPGWWSLATQLEQLSDDLAAARLRVSDVSDLAAQRGLDLGTSELRWRALVELDRRYHETLQSLGIADRQTARLDAITNRTCRYDHDIVLLGTVDLSRLLTDMLRGVTCEVTALVAAPESHADGFDELGGLNVTYWQDQQVDVHDEMLRIVDQPRALAMEAVRAIAAVQPLPTADDITIGLGDERLAGAVTHALGMANLPSRHAAGRKVAGSRPTTLLAALGRFAGQQRFDDLAALLRHPDVERYVRSPASESVERWLTVLDQYATRRLQGDVRGGFHGEPEVRGKLESLRQRIEQLLPQTKPMPLPDWSEPIAAALRAIYGERSLARYDREDEQLIQALDTIAGALREQAALEPSRDAVPTVSAAQAVTLTLDRVADAIIPEPGGEPVIELMGFLELPLDDAPVTIITSLNEGAIPASRNADAFLPNGLRAALDMPDNARRYARDLYHLSTIIHSRPNVTLIACRRSAEGEPLAPSRLLLACDDEAIVQRITDFYEERSESSASPLLLPPGERDMFLIPKPLLAEPILTKLRVTAFRDYLACPYRFYLRHVLKLRGLDDRAVEMDALAFGNLAHDVLERFGRSDTARSDHADDIANFLGDTLDAIARKRFGNNLRSALRVQVEQLRRRLRRFAERQAQWTADGWAIRSDLVETEQQATLDVDGQPFTITGKIDRIDEHPDRGLRILDYKTSDTANDPDRTHREGPRGDKQWVDVQLPLYRRLAESLGITGQVELGYINLPKKLDDVDVALAAWDDAELDDAMSECDVVIRGLRAQRFWPPREPPRFADDFTRICADEALNRDQIIEASGGAAS